MSGRAASSPWLEPSGNRGDAAPMPCDQPALVGLQPEIAWQCARRLTGTTRSVRRGAVECWQGRGLLFGTLALDERVFRSAGTGATALQHATETGYRELFGCLASTGYPHLVRVWNYLPRINAIESGVERYRQFNIGRQDAFLACARSLTESVPAACALGSREGPLRIGFLAARTPARALENPRQLSAYRYPSAYGPRSPTFSRAALIEPDGRELLLISGTASIVGHRSMHQGDLAAQTRETIANLEAVIAAANAALDRPCFSPDSLEYVVYLRSGESLPVAAAALDRWLGKETQRRFMLAEVCRRELLIEIEASSRPDITGGAIG